MTTTNTYQETRLRSPEGKPGDQEKLQSLLSRAQSHMPTPRERAVREFHATVARVLRPSPSLTHSKSPRLSSSGSALIPALLTAAAVIALVLCSMWLVSIGPEDWKNHLNGADVRDGLLMIGLHLLACVISFLCGANWSLHQARTDRRRLRLNVQSRAKF